jgi:tRNA(fMet)-specific endonuclease VapC
VSEYLLDTNTVSYILKGHEAARRRLSAVPIREVAISAVTEGELQYGIARLPANARLKSIVEEFLIRVAVHPWDSEAAQEYGRVRAEQERAGRTLGNLDTMIAAHALARGSILVTSDRAFSRVKGLAVEDWSKR